MYRARRFHKYTPPPQAFLMMVERLASSYVYTKIIANINANLMLVAGLFARDRVIADVSTAPCDLHCKLVL